ncbi:MAG TPA: hypothetical protein DGK91_05995 [Clostridium sp.]|jgi:flagellar assembly protein FliH|nr:hypothetical protein [Clostridia bacterium]HCW04111.1 hypothetical protein [Clostridium sp.]
MQSSFKVIKDTKVVAQGSKPIITQYSPTNNTISKLDNDDEKSIDYNASLQLLNDAKRESERIIKEAQEGVERLQQQAYEEAYNAGYQEAQKKGYQDGYEAALQKAKGEANQIIENAVQTLNKAKEEYELYLRDKKTEIINLSINIAKHILNREVSQVDGLDKMVEEAIEESRNAKSIIVKANSLHIENLKTKILEWKERFALKAEVFVLMDDSLDKGSAVIEKNNGKITINIDEALDNIRGAII